MKGKIEDPWPILAMDFVDEIMMYDLNEQNPNATVFDAKSKTGNFIQLARSDSKVDFIFGDVMDKKEDEPEHDLFLEKGHRRMQKAKFQAKLNKLKMLKTT